MTEFGRRLDDEFTSLGYESKAQIVRAFTGFRASEGWQQVTEKLLRNWLKQHEPNARSLHMLHAIGVDTHYCLFGVRGDRRDLVGFDVSSRIDRLAEAGSPGLVSVRWRAPEALHMAKVLQPGVDNPEATITTAEVLVAFCHCLVLRAIHEGTQPIENAVATDTELLNLMLWYQLWMQHFGVPRDYAPSVPELEGVAKGLHNAVEHVRAERHRQRGNVSFMTFRPVAARSHALETTQPEQA